MFTYYCDVSTEAQSNNKKLLEKTNLEENGANFSITYIYYENLCFPGSFLLMFYHEPKLSLSK